MSTQSATHSSQNSRAGSARRVIAPFCQRLLLVLLLCLCFPLIAIAGTADDDYDAAIAHYKKARWKLASEAFTGFIAQHKTDRRIPFARLYYGVSLENLEKYKEARDVLRGFVKDYPKNLSRSDAQYRVAECSYFLRDLKAAELEFLEFLKEKPNHAFAEFALPYLGDVQYRLSRFKESAATCELALKKYKNGRMADEARFVLATCHIALKKPDAALKLFQELAARPESPFAADAQTERAQLLFQLQRYEESAKAFDDFATRFKTHPKVLESRLNAGYAYFRLNKFETAIDRFQQADDDKSIRPTAVFWNAASHKAIKKYAEAVTLLKAEFTRDPATAMAPRVLYEWAACERLQNRFAEAGTRYLDFVKRWPKHDDADDALHYAGEMALLDGKPKDANKLVERFRRDYPKSNLWSSTDLLQARIDAEIGDKSQLPKTVKLLDNLIVKSASAEKRSLARYHLTRIHRMLGNHKQALQAVAPLVNQAEREGPGSMFVGAVILAGRSQLADKQFEKAITTATLYLKLKPNDDQVVVAMTVRATAAWETGKTEILHNDVDSLLKNSTDNSPARETVYRLAEKSYQKKDWKLAAELFDKLTVLGKKSRFHPLALSGRGWSQFERKQYAKASKTFGQLLQDHPDHVLASQAAYKQAECDEHQNDLAAAATKYEAAFQKYAPEKPAAEGTEQPGKKHYYTYHAGLNAARTFARLKKLKQADAAYDALFAKFPKPDKLDARLDEWALLNYNAGHYKRADEIFRRLIRDVPKSSLVDNARYTLAESDLNAGKQKEARKVFRELYNSLKSDSLIREVSLYRLIGIGAELQEWKTVQSDTVAFRKDFPKSEHRWYAAFNEAEARFHQNDLKTCQPILQMLRSQKAESPIAKAGWYPRVWVLLAEAAARQTEYKTVASVVAEGKKRFEKWPRIYLLDEILGRSLKRQAKFKEARDAFGRVVNHAAARRTETAAKCQFLIAETHLMQDDWAAARREYFRVDSLYDFPDWQAPSLLMAGQCAEKLKEYQEAVKTYEDLIKRFPKSAFSEKAKPRLADARKLANNQP